MKASKVVDPVAEMIRLAERWANPTPWQVMLESFIAATSHRDKASEHARTRLEHVREMVRRPDRQAFHSAEIAECENLQADESKTAEVYIKSHQQYRAELDRLGSLVREHAPELLGDMPNVDLRKVQTDEQIMGYSQSMKRLLGALLSRRGEGKPPVEPKGKASKLAMAMALLADHPDWPDNKIADQAGASPEYLSRNPKYKAARAAVAEVGKQSHHRAKRHRGQDMDEYT